MPPSRINRNSWISTSKVTHNAAPPVTSLAVVILTHDEAIHIGRAIDSVADIASEIFLVDSGSTDGTIAIAQGKGAVVAHHAWVNYADQFQWGLDMLPITADWVMRLDADEVIEPDLRRDIAAKLGELSPEVTGVNLQRKHIFMGRWIRHGGRYPLTLLRIWRRGCGRIEQRWMDEHMVLTQGQAVTLTGGFADINMKDIAFFIDKHNKYAAREAVDVINQHMGLFAREEAGVVGASAQAMAKRGWKERFYNRLPFGAGPVLYFLYRYIVQGGFLDGREGAIYHGLQGLWYRFLVDAKIEEFTRGIGDARGDEALARLSALTGLDLRR